MQHRFGSADPVEDHACGQAKLRHPHQLCDSLLWRLAGQWEKHDKSAVRLLIQLARPVVDGANARGAQFRVLDGRYLLVGTVHEFGVHSVTVHIFASIFGICRAKDAWLRLLRQPRPRIAVSGSQADSTPSHTAPRVPLDNPSPSAIGFPDDSRPILLEFSR